MFEPFFKRHGLSFCALFFTGKIFFNTSALYGGLIQKIPLSLLFFFFFLNWVLILTFLKNVQTSLKKSDASFPVE
jgi:hypothetical protein